MKRKQIIFFLLAGVLLSSCSIKEDRSPCPCWLDVFFDVFPAEGVSISAYDSHELFDHKINVEPESGFEEYEVPRTFVSLCAYRRLSGVNASSGKVIISKGNQSDSLYSHLSRVNCTGEFAEDTVKLHKQFATVYLTFENAEGASDAYLPKIKGKVCGLDLTSLDPINGDFEYMPDEPDNLIYQFRLPRQKDSSIQMELYKKSDGSFADTIELGRLIENSGYDWTAVDLKDIVVTVDFAKVEMEISVREWASEDIYDITI